MPAPFGGTLTDAPEYTANEVYEIDQRDPCQGAGLGALFSGIGIQNEPHQQLANRTAFLKGRQDTNIANITTLQAFMAMFTSSVGGSGTGPSSVSAGGWRKFPQYDAALGLIQMIEQWGIGGADNATSGSIWVVTFPIAFLSVVGSLLITMTDGAPYGPTGVVKSGSVSLNGFSAVYSDDPSATSPMNPFYWRAIGY